MKDRFVDISPRTIRRRLAEAGFRYGVPIRKQLLTEDHIKYDFNGQWITETLTSRRLFLQMRQPSYCFQ